MSKLISGEKLKQLIKDGIIENGKEENVEGLKYDFCLGDKFLKTKHQGPAKISDFNPSEKENYSIEPGETVFVLSLEKLNLPKNIKAELSHKRKLAHLGILVLGGFCVDPLYEGYLIFGMYNFSNQPFRLSNENQKVIAAQFYELSEEEILDFPKPEALRGFPDELIAISKGMKPISLQGLESHIEDVSNRLASIEKDLKDQGGWFEKLQVKIEALTDITNNLGRHLDEERVERQSGQKALEREHDKLSKLIEIEQKISEDLSDSLKSENLVRKVALWIIILIITTSVSVSAVLITNYLCSKNNTLCTTQESINPDNKTAQ